MPVLALLCCFCGSESDGERDRLRFESASGMANSVFKYWFFNRRMGFKACLSRGGGNCLGQKSGVCGRSLMEIHGNMVRKGMRGRRIGEKCDKLHTNGDNAANKGKLVDSSNKPLL